MAKRRTGRTVKKAPRRALCVGINDYPYEGNDLNGCVNDAHAWAELLTQHFRFPSSDVKVILDSEATKKNILNELKSLLAGANTGDTLVFTNSSHGSYIADKSGDEERYDEILCPYDIEDNHILDDELRELIADLKDGVRLTGLSLPFDGQPMQGFSGIKAMEDGTFWSLSDNGFGNKLNSTDAMLMLHHVKMDWDAGKVEALKTLFLTDPDKKAPFPIVMEGSDKRYLTGADFDVESIQPVADEGVYLFMEFRPETPDRQVNTAS